MIEALWRVCNFGVFQGFFLGFLRGSVAQEQQR